MTGSSVAVAVVGHRVANEQPTGVDRYERELVGALARRDDTSLVVSGPPEPRSAHLRGTPDWVPPGVPVRLVRGPRRAIVLAWWTIGRPRIDRRSGPVDLVHVTLPVFPCPTRRPVVYTIHDLFPRRHPEWYALQDRIGHNRALRALEGAAAVIAVSTWTAEAVSTLPWVDPDDVVVVPEGVAPRFGAARDEAAVARACLDLDVEPHGFDLFVGQASARKDLAVVVEALRSARSPRSLVIAGPPGDATEAVQEAARRSGVDHLLRWAGFVPDETLHLLLHGARALLHPCPSEGFGFTPLEAMAAGTATVVADAGALPETVGDAALRCAPGDPGAWAAAMDSLEDHALVEDLGRRGRQWVKRYDWDEVADQTVAVYRRALDRTR